MSRTFCRAFADLAVSAKEAAGVNDFGERAVAKRVHQDARAVVEVVPDDAPGQVTAFFGALGEMAELSQVWQNPATGGIKEEYVDDFGRLLGVVTGDKAKVTGRFVTDGCPGTAIARKGPLSGLRGSSGAVPGAGGASPATSAPEVRPATASVLLDDGPASVYEQVKVDVGKVTATDALRPRSLDPTLPPPPPARSSSMSTSRP